MHISIQSTQNKGFEVFPFIPLHVISSLDAQSEKYLLLTEQIQVAHFVCGLSFTISKLVFKTVSG